MKKKAFWICYVFIVFTFPLLLSCSSNESGDNGLEQYNKKQLVKNKFFGTWKLITFIDFTLGKEKEYIQFDKLTERQIEYYGLNDNREISFSTSKVTYYDGREYVYYIQEWGKTWYDELHNWGSEIYEYSLVLTGTTYGNYNTVFKFTDNNTLYWIDTNCGYIYKRK